MYALGRHLLIDVGCILRETPLMYQSAAQKTSVTTSTGERLPEQTNPAALDSEVEIARRSRLATRIRTEEIRRGDAALFRDGSGDSLDHPASKFYHS